MPTHPLLEKLTQSLSSHSIRAGTLLVAVSGGADSVALLLGLLSLRDDFHLDLRAIHVDHGLREDSTADAEWVHVLCAAHSVPCVIEELNLAKTSTGSPVSEDEARTARYQIFQQVATHAAASWVATAHTADDQAETVLHHILRGTSWRGLQGIPVRRPLTDSCALLRPLLQVTRREIEDYLQDLGQGYRTDDSNRSAHYTRNRLRNTVLPLLRKEYGEQVDESLRRLSTQAGELVNYLDSEAARRLQESLLERTATQVRLSCEVWEQQVRLIIREACVLLWEQQNWPRQEMTSRHWNLLADVLQGAENRRESLPGRIQVERRGGLAAITRSEPPSTS